MVAVAAILAWLLRHNSASVRFWIWFVASMKFLVPFAVISAAARLLPWPESALPPSDALAVVNRVFSASAAATISQAWVTAIGVVWLTGTTVVVARWLREWNRATAIARDAEPVNDGPVFDSLRRLEHDFDIRTPLPIVCSSHGVEPGIVGIPTPVLVWPQHLSAGLRHNQIEPILAHELAHVVRRDNLLASLHMVATAAFWFHPVVWWIGTRLIEERERACDEHVLSLGQSPAAYAAGILRTCELCLASPVVNVSGITGGDLKKRLTRILRNQPRTLNLLQRAALAVIAIFVFAVPIAIGSSQGTEQKSPLQNDNSEQPARPGRGVTSPRLKKEVRPHYSERAKAEKIEGEVLMECVVKADGTVGDIKITKSLDPDLDQAAVDAAKQWEFEPGTRDGKPVAVLVTIAMAFTLK
jgi:TonB family protein